MNPYEPVASVEPEPATVATQPPPGPIYHPLSLWGQWTLVFAGILVPIGSHLFSFVDSPLTPEWQTGELGDKLAFILSPQAGFVFYPALAYAIMCLTLYLLYDHKEPVAFWVQLGILGGIPVALWYSIVFDIAAIETAQEIGLVLGQFGVPLGIYAILRLFRWLHRRTIFPIGWYVIAAIFVGGTVVGCVFDFESTMGTMVFGPIVASLYCGTVWAFLVYAYASSRLLRDPRKKTRWDTLEKSSGLAYFAYIFLSCPISVLFSLNKYSSLPTQPPSNCYVVTAAARGHRRFVGSKIEVMEGIELPVNSQLLRLRSLERLLQDSLPNGHRKLRCVYDFVGPKLAARLSNPWIADLAYLTLKPVEWVAIVLLFFFQSRRSNAMSHQHLA